MNCLFKIGGLFSEKGQLRVLHGYMVDIIDLTRRALYREKSFLHQRFIVEGRTYQEIASELGCSRTTAKNFLRLYEISKR